MPLKKPEKSVARGKRRAKTLLTFFAGFPLAAVAHTARYVSSEYHRPPGSLFGRPKQRKYPHASKCPADWTQDRATNALREAILAGRVSTEWRGGFPRHAWHEENGVLYEAFLSNQGNGEYHAYPLSDRREWPEGLQ
jgi:hypothetical protein